MNEAPPRFSGFALFRPSSMVYVLFILAAYWTLPMRYEHSVGSIIQAYLHNA